MGVDGSHCSEFCSSVADPRNRTIEPREDWKELPRILS